MDRKGVMWRKGDLKGDTYIIPFIEHSQNDKIIEMGNKLAIARLGMVGKVG